MIRVMVVYDVTADKVRKKVSDTCLDYGLDRTQYSVFQGLLKTTQVKAISKKLRALLDEGHILIVPIASDDWDRRVEIDCR